MFNYCGQIKKLFFLFGFVFFFLISGYSQFSITGPTCVVAGTQYTYTISGPWTNSTNMNWFQTTGTINGSGSGTPLPQIHVTWSANGTVKVTTTNPSGSASLNVTIINALSPGTLNSYSQNINYNTIPGTIISLTSASGGNCSPVFAYQWQQSTDDVNFTNISGATSVSLSFTSPLTQTMYYRRKVTETGSGSIAYTPVATVLVYPALVPGTVNSSQTINFNLAPAPLTLSGVSGGTNSYTYQWQYSLDAVTWMNIGNGTGYGNASTFAPPALQVLTNFRVVVTSNGVSANSGTATITVNPELLAGTISPGFVFVNSGTSPGEITSTLANGGGCSGSYAYQLGQYIQCARSIYDGNHLHQ